MVKKLFEKGYLALILAILYLPIFLIIVFSFSGATNFTFPEGQPVLDSYIDIFTSSKSGDLAQALANTLIIASISATISAIFGSVASVGIYSLSRRMRNLVNNVNQLPIINSEIVMAVSFMLFTATLHIPVGYVSLILAHIAFCTPYVVLSVMPKLIAMDPNVYEAALDLGAGPVRALVKVILPIMTPGIVSGFVMAFTLSMDDFIITVLNGGDEIKTLSTFLYFDLKRQGLEPFWFAIFSIIFIIVLAIILLANMYSQRAVKKGDKK